jgi:hypothetical protein
MCLKKRKDLEPDPEQIIMEHYLVPAKEKGPGSESVTNYNGPDRKVQK